MNIIPPFARTLLLTLAASSVSAIAGYAYAIHSHQTSGAAPDRRQSASPAPYAQPADASVLVPPASWTRWPQLTDY